MSNNELKRYPIGHFDEPKNITDIQVDEFIKVIKEFPSKLRDLIENFSDEQLDTPYREKGWTVRQLVNHLADSHANAFIRFKLALTEENPIIKPYHEAKWTELQDSASISIKPAMRMLKGIHQRWYHLLKSLTNRQFERTFHHPEQGRNYDLRVCLAIYVWHCNHHFAHIENLKNEQGW